MTTQKTPGEVALEKELADAREGDGQFDDKCAYWQEQMDSLLNGRIPMRMAESKQGQAELDEINAKVSAAMTARYGE